MGDSQVSVLGRNTRSNLQVWSIAHGYPGDFDYRELERRDGLSGLRYWRVTGARIDLTAKDWYHPDWAEGKISIHADHFARIVEDVLREYHERTGQYGVLATICDASLFGTWWFEGVRWLGEVLARLARSETVELCTADAYVEANPPAESIALPESSWGMGGKHFTWDNVDTDWMWPIVHAAEARLERLAATHRRRRRHPAGHALAGRARAFAAAIERLAVLDDHRSSPEFAVERFREHAERFDRLATLAESGPLDEGARRLAADLWERDKVFADVDYRDWTPRASARAPSLSPIAPGEPGDEWIWRQQPRSEPARASHVPERTANGS